MNSLNSMKNIFSLSNEELSNQLKKFHQRVGKVTDTTRSIYERKLANIIKQNSNDALKKLNVSKSSKPSCIAKKVDDCDDDCVILDVVFPSPKKSEAIITESSTPSIPCDQSMNLTKFSTNKNDGLNSENSDNIDTSNNLLQKSLKDIQNHSLSFDKFFKKVKNLFEMYYKNLPKRKDKSVLSNVTSEPNDQNHATIKANDVDLKMTSILFLIAFTVILYALIVNEELFLDFL